MDADDTDRLRASSPRQSTSWQVWLIVGIYGTLGAATLAILAISVPVKQSIALPFSPFGFDPRLAGLLLWAGVCLVTSSLGLREEGRAVLHLGMGPIIAAAALGGPTAGAWVAFLGTFEMRELSGRVPWYGVVANHGQAILGAATCGLVIGLFGETVGDSSRAAVSFVSIVAGTIAGLGVLALLSLLAFAVRTGRSLRDGMPLALRQFVMVETSEVVVAWLLSWSYLLVAWWSAALFILVDGAAASSLARHRAAWDLRHDRLTELPNGIALDERVAELRRSAATTGLAVFYIDLDGFKAINDTHDHNVGDDVLRVVGTRLADACREGDFLARLHGDEFVVLAAGVSGQAEAHLLADRLAAAVEPTMEHAAGQLHVSATVGFQLVQDAAAIKADLRAADRAMSAAKGTKAGAADRTRRGR